MKSWYVLREKVCYLNKKQTFSIIDIVKSETPLHQLIAYSGCNLFFLPKFGLIMAKEKHKTFLLYVAGQWVENFSKDLRSIFIFHLLLLLEIFWTLKIPHGLWAYVKFIYSEKATKFCKISTLLLSYVL